MKKIKLKLILVVCCLLLISTISHAGTYMQIDNLTKNAVSNTNSEFLTVNFIVTDPLGRRGGMDALTGKSFEEFDVGYGGGDRTGFPDEDELPDNVMRDFYVEASFGQLIDGDYIIEVTGLEGGGIASYLLSVGIKRKIRERANAEFFGVVETGLPVKYIITYSSDPSKPVATAVKFADPAALKQDITTSYKMGLMDSDGVMNSLMSKANAIEASIAKGNKATARSQLDALVNELNAQKDKHVASDAVKILIEDAQYIKDHL